MIDDGSPDATARRGRGTARRRPAALQPRHRRRRADRASSYALEHGYVIAVRLDGDGQHDPPSSRSCSPRSTRRGRHRPGLALRPARRLPAAARASDRHHWFARSLGPHRPARHGPDLRASRRRTAAGPRSSPLDYPRDYPEVEATVLVHKQRLRLVEVPVQMREREHGVSSIAVAALALLHAQGDARTARRRWWTVRRSGGGAGSRDSRQDLDRRVDRVAPAAPRRARADPRAAPEGALRAAVARTGLVLLVLSAWRGGLNTIAGWLGVAPTRRRSCSPSRPCSSSRAPPLLDGAVALDRQTCCSRSGVALLDERLRRLEDAPPRTDASR